MSATKDFGRHVRSCRKARGLTQEALAKVSGLSPDTIRRMEGGNFWLSYRFSGPAESH